MYTVKFLRECPDIKMFPQHLKWHFVPKDTLITLHRQAEQIGGLVYVVYDGKLIVDSSIKPYAFGEESI